jgi:hypothetical protein
MKKPTSLEGGATDFRWFGPAALLSPCAGSWHLEGRRTFEPCDSQFHWPKWSSKSLFYPLITHTKINIYIYIHIYIYVDVIYACIHISTLYWTYRTTSPEIYSMGATSACEELAGASIIGVQLGHELCCQLRLFVAWGDRADRAKPHRNTTGEEWNCKGNINTDTYIYICMYKYIINNK